MRVGKARNDEFPENLIIMRITSQIKLLALVLLLCGASCGTGNGDDGPEPAIPELIINEVCGVSGSEWIEILNTSDGRVDMGGMKIVYTDPASKADVTLATVSDGVALSAGAYHVFDRADGSLRGGFDMSRTLVLRLVTARGKDVSVFDRDKEIGTGETHSESGSYARFPDASKTWIVSALPTKGAENRQAAPLPALLINEVYAVSGGEWIEIVNTSDADADMGGMRIVCKIPGGDADMTLVRIPDGTSVAGGAYRVFDRSDGGLGAGFDMTKSLVLSLVSAKGEALSVFDRDLEIGVDKTHPVPGSYSRFPDGSDTWVVTTTPTKAAANQKTQPPPVIDIQNAIWMWSVDFPSADFAAMARYGINHVIVHEAAVSDMGETAFKKRVDAAKAAGVKTHLWFVCFKPSTGWVNPIDISVTPKKFNQTYFDELIGRAKKYAGYGNIAGIHLDYVRYPGTGALVARDHNYSQEVNASAAITEFCRQMSVAVKAVDPGIKLSAALMNEYNNGANVTYYGQDTRKMAQHIDIIMPMVYRYPGKSDNWVFNTTKWFADEAKLGNPNAQVWAGVTTYSSDTPIVRLSPAQLERDCGLTIRKGGVDSGSTGVVLFRHSLVNYFDMTTDYYYYN